MTFLEILNINIYKKLYIYIFWNILFMVLWKRNWINVFEMMIIIYVNIKDILGIHNVSCLSSFSYLFWLRKSWLKTVGKYWRIGVAYLRHFHFCEDFWGFVSNFKYGVLIWRKYATDFSIHMSYEWWIVL